MALRQPNVNKEGTGRWTQSSSAQFSMPIEQADVPLWFSPPVVPWKHFAEDKLGNFAMYAQDNWDEEGALAISTSVRVAAYALFVKLIKMLELPKPNIIPGFRGDIIILWARNGYETKITINAEGYYLFTEKQVASGVAKDFGGWTSLKGCIALAEQHLNKIF